MADSCAVFLWQPEVFASDVAAKQVVSHVFVAAAALVSLVQYV